MVYMYHSFLIHSSADGHLGCFHVLAIPSFSKISFDFSVNLLICPQVGILFWCVDGRGIVIFVCFRLRLLRLVTEGSPSHAKCLFRGSSLMIRFRWCEGIQMGVSESRSETQEKPLPQVIRFPYAMSVLLDHATKQVFGVNFFLFLYKMLFWCNEIFNLMQKILSK